MNSNTRVIKITDDQKMIAGIQKHLTTLSSFPVGSQSMSLTDIVKVFQDRIASAQAAQTAHATSTAAVKADRDKRALTSPTTGAFRRIVQGMFAQSPDILADFGLTPIALGKRTVATKALAIAKNKATRTARHTMGTKQKELIKGTVVTDAPATAPAASLPAASTAPVIPAAPTAAPSAPSATVVPSAAVTGSGTPHTS